ncbi:hypothetical protein, partial [Enterococcus avium]|uniref:hypothetical protein n=1 Tax=Enterococcus avium TaxID=33945 RepID=UPI001C9E1A81
KNNICYDVVADKGDRLTKVETKNKLVNYCSYPGMHDVFKRGMNSLKNKLIVLSIIKLVRALKESKGRCVK